jgi:GT2 family glycosyltransferase
MSGIEGEIIVVDNASVDRTPQLVQEHFPEVRLIANQINVGFAKANNQGIEISVGEYVLLLNPDTLVSENTFHICLAFMDQHPEAGAIGVKMIDGSGRYLPESKRGLPTLKSSFMKMTGLYRIFPHAKGWNDYYQGHKDENEIAMVDVLTGAFMFIRSKVLLQTGGLDEAFFMYGEDIDLSYRITRANYKIYYVPTTTIIHYKGESTRKSTLNYIMTFYQAMLIFTTKHPEFRGQRLLIRLAIYLHATMQFVRQTVSKWWPPLADTLVLVLAFYCISALWARYYFQQPNYFSQSFYSFNIPLYTIIAIVSFYLNGAYDKPYTMKSSWLGFGWGLLFILVVYSVLPAHLRSSRMVILLSSVILLIWLFLSRRYLYPWRVFAQKNKAEDRRTVIVAGSTESNRIKELINRSQDQIDIVGIVTPEPGYLHSQNHVLGHIGQLKDVIRVHRIKEIIFSVQDIPFSTFTSLMTSLGEGYRYMLAASATMNIVGSMSRDAEGESYAIRVHFKLSSPSAKRTKRIFDVLTAIFFLVISPLIFFLLKNRKHFFSNLLNVLSGKKTFVSYDPNDPSVHSLPPLPQGILYPGYIPAAIDGSRRLQHIHYVYARDYHWTTDLAIVSQHWKRLGHKNETHAA